MFAVFAIAAVCLSSPVNGEIVGHYSPVGQYVGHWGVDYGALIGDPVSAPVAGKVTFAGSVAGMKTITVEPVAGFKVSVSYLDSISVSTGDVVSRGQVVGSAGSPHGVPGVHLSTRINGRYLDPKTQVGCAKTDITRALRLLPPPQPYPRPRANRNPRRDLRPDSHRPSARRRMRIAPIRSRSSAGDAGRGSLAEGRP